MDSTDDARFATQAFDGIDLPAYAATCRALVRAGGHAGRVAAALRIVDLDEARWEAVRAAWSERIREDVRVRAAFQRLYTEIE